MKRVPAFFDSQIKLSFHWALLLKKLNGKIMILYQKEIVIAMQLIKKSLDEEILDDILKEAADGYGDLIAAALVHNVSVLSLRTRVAQLHNLRAPWI
jgi:hypothetical protein